MTQRYFFGGTRGPTLSSLYSRNLPTKLSRCRARDLIYMSVRVLGTRLAGGASGARVSAGALTLEARLIARSDGAASVAIVGHRASTSFSSSAGPTVVPKSERASCSLPGGLSALAVRPSHPGAGSSPAAAALVVSSSSSIVFPRASLDLSPQQRRGFSTLREFADRLRGAAPNGDNITPPVTQVNLNYAPFTWFFDFHPAPLPTVDTRGNRRPILGIFGFVLAYVFFFVAAHLLDLKTSIIASLPREAVESRKQLVRGFELDALEMLRTWFANEIPETRDTVLRNFDRIAYLGGVNWQDVSSLRPSMLLHAFMHTSAHELAASSVLMLLFGTKVYHYLGPARFFLLYTAGAVATSAVHGIANMAAHRRRAPVSVQDLLDPRSPAASGCAEDPAREGAVVQRLPARAVQSLTDAGMDFRGWSGGVDGPAVMRFNQFEADTRISGARGAVYTVMLANALLFPLDLVKLGPLRVALPLGVALAIFGDIILSGDRFARSLALLATEDDGPVEEAMKLEKGRLAAVRNDATGFEAARLSKLVVPKKKGRENEVVSIDPVSGAPLDANRMPIGRPDLSALSSLPRPPSAAAVSAAATGGAVGVPLSSPSTSPSTLPPEAADEYEGPEYYTDSKRAHAVAAANAYTSLRAARDAMVAALETLQSGASHASDPSSAAAAGGAGGAAGAAAGTLSAAPPAKLSSEELRDLASAIQRAYSAHVIANSIDEPVRHAGSGPTGIGMKGFHVPQSRLEAFEGKEVTAPDAVPAFDWTQYRMLESTASRKRFLQRLTREFPVQYQPQNDVWLSLPSQVEAENKVTKFPIYLPTS